jgi:hypothetical protein
VVDRGRIVNPDVVTAQIESGVIYRISGALWGEITLKKRPGRAVQLQRLSRAADERSSLDTLLLRPLVTQMLAP